MKLQKEGKAWKMWVSTTSDNPESYATNSCVYASKEEAERAGVELAGRWLAVVAWEARPTDEPVNYRFPLGAARPERIED